MGGKEMSHRNFVIYNKVTGRILRYGSCPAKDFDLQTQNENEEIFEGKGNDVTQKVEFDGLDDEGQPINPRVIDKTPEEIEAEKLPEPKSIPFDKQPAHITNEQLQDILSRLSDLEK